MAGDLQLILSVDYETFGNGTGDLGQCVVEPAERMRVIAGRYGAPITFFVEVLEFSALSEREGYIGSVERVKVQLRELIGEGHDLQLHLHPQWIEREGDHGPAKLDFSRWRIGDLPGYEVDRLLKFGKHWLEEWIRPVSESYRCNVFRAGGWCIQPSRSVVEALLRNGFSMESTVAPGLRNPSWGQWYNFSSVPAAPYWRVDGDVCSESVRGLVEVPIATGRIDRRRHLAVARETRKHGMAPGCHGTYGGPGGRLGGLTGKLHKLGNLGKVMLDYSTMPADILIDITKQWIDKHKNAYKPLPVLGIGHTKNFSARSERSLDTYLDWALSQGLEFSTFQQWHDKADV